MQKNTIIVSKNNITPKQEICVFQVDTLAEPTSDESTTVDYDSLSAPEKIQFDDCMSMILSKIPA
jgi:hypothetical protein